MKTRIISALVMLPMLAFIWLGGRWLFFLVLLLSAIGLREFYNAFRHIDVVASEPVGFAELAVLYGLIYYSYFVLGDSDFFSQITGAWFFVSFVGAMLIALFGKDHVVMNGLITFAGVVYVGYFMAHIIFFDQLGEGRVLIWLCIITAFATDIFAYFGGMLFGKHKLAPVISPKKTVEGSVCGIICCTLLCVAYGMIFDAADISHCAIIGIVGSLAAQAGDLTASAFKRRTGIKDYGNLIPGHGGILDRFDSMIFTIPFVYYCTILIVHPIF